MKKLFVFTLLAFGITSQAQVTFSPGVRTGLNLANVGELEASYKADFYVSFVGALNLTRVYTLQPEIGYSRQGAMDVPYHVYNYNTGDTSTGITDLQLNYMTTSIMNRFNIAQFNIAVGPTFDFLMSHNMDHRENNVDIGISFGLGYKSDSGFGIEARLKQGIVDVVSHDFYGGDNDYFFDDYNTNTVIQLGVFYLFDLKKKEQNVD